MTPILDDKTWAQGAIQQLAVLASFPASTSAITLLRHSHRQYASTSEVTVDEPLTDEGREAAYEFGSRLPSNQVYRVYHSRVHRCQETAELLAKGLQDRSVTCLSLQSLNVITTIETNHPQISALYKRDRHQSIYKWAAGHYTQDIIEPFTSYVRRAANIIWNQQLKNPNTIGLYITHDFHLMALQFGWSGVIFPQEWVSYLDGFVLQLDADLIHFYKPKDIPIPYPKWWKMVSNTNVK